MVRQRGQIGLAELIAALSLATDLGVGAPAESALRTALLAVSLARMHGLCEQDVVCAYYGALLRHVGCTAVAHEEARIAVDDIQLKRALMPADPGRLEDLLGRVVRGVGRGSPGRFRSVVRFLTTGHAATAHIFASRCEVAVRLSTRLGMGKDVERLLWEASERWDGKGLPRGVGGEALGAPARVLMLAELAALFFRLAGHEAACAEVDRRDGGHLDPDVCATFRANAAELLDRIAGDSVWSAALEAEPGVARTIDDSELDDVITVLSDFADLKSTFTLGHSKAVASLARSAGEALGLETDELTCLQRAALLHDLGRVSVSNSIWDKPGPLDDREWEQVRMHAYHGERIVARVPELRRAGELAAADHERLDGSGYYRRVPGSALSVAARVLAAADVYQALIEQRPHRPAREPSQAAAVLTEEVGAGRLDREAVTAVLGAAGHRVKQARGAWPAGLSEREVEVLRLVARGLSNKQIARALAISPRTVQHHTSHVYAKIGVESRAAAALFATEHDLLRR
jgi:HD-GYP domain-containing protein (c-di-GMP phosphodiesterase class II)